MQKLTRRIRRNTWNIQNKVQHGVEYDCNKTKRIYMNIRILFVILFGQESNESVLRSIRRLDEKQSYFFEESANLLQSPFLLSFETWDRSNRGCPRRCPTTRSCEFYDRAKIVGRLGGTSRLVKPILGVSWDNFDTFGEGSDLFTAATVLKAFFTSAERYQ